MQRAPLIMLLAFLGSCGSPPAPLNQTPLAIRDRLITSEALSADPDELRHDLLLQLQDRTGRFINRLDGQTAALLRSADLTPTQRTWLQVLRLDGVQGVLWAIQQEDIVDSEIETLFFSRLLRRLKGPQADALFGSDHAGRINTMLADLESIFWKPVAGTLDVWESHLTKAADAFVSQDPDCPSIAFTSSELYVLADSAERDRLSGMFGLDARLEMAARGIGHLNQTAERAIFLAEFLPLLLTLHAELTAADLVVSLSTGPLRTISELPGHVDQTINSLVSRLADQREQLSESLQSTTASLAATLVQFDHDLSEQIKSINDTLGQKLYGLGDQVVANGAAMQLLSQEVAQNGRAMQALTQSATQLDSKIAALSAAVDRLSGAIEDIPENAMAAIEHPPSGVEDAMAALEGRLQLNLALVIAGTMVAGMVLVWIGVRAGRR